MVLSDEERAIVLGYALPNTRAGLAALLALDDQLAAILRTTREPMVGEMRLTWWHGALEALDVAPAPAQPELLALSAAVVPRVSGATLARQVEGWEELLDPAPLDGDRLLRFATLRGEALFAAAGIVTGADARDPVALAGRGWALADLAAHVRDEGGARAARAMAFTALAEATAARWSRAGRALGAMAHLAAMPDRIPPVRAARILWHRTTGR